MDKTTKFAMSDAALMTLVRTIVTADDTFAFRLLAANPELAKARFEIGATRQTAETYYMEDDSTGQKLAFVKLTSRTAASLRRPRRRR